MCRTCFESLQFYDRSVTLKLPDPLIDQVIASFEYQGAIKPLLHQMKYHSVKGIAEYLGTLIYYTTHLPAADLVTSVPLHPQRYSQRGFNQAEVMAKSLSYLLKLPYTRLLLRRHQTASQASLLNREKRWQNLAGIFELEKTLTDQLLAAPQLFHGKTILLIDDVCTTGATLNESAKVLKKTGCQQIIGVVAAHGA